MTTITGVYKPKTARAATHAMYAALVSILRNAGYESGEAEPTLTELRVARVYLEIARRAVLMAEGRGSE